MATDRPARLAATAAGVRVRPVLSAGDVVGGELLGHPDHDQRVPWYFTGEESTDQDVSPTGGRGGSSIALNATTGHWTGTRHFGLFEHENVVPVKGFTRRSRARASCGLGPDGQGDGNPSSNDIAKGQTLHGHFMPLDQADNASAATLEAAAQAKSAFDFVRVEDLAVSKTRRGRPG